MEYKLIHITEKHLAYADENGIYQTVSISELAWGETLPRFNKHDSYQILKYSRNNRGEYTLDRSGRLLWTPRAMNPIFIILVAVFVGCMTMSVMCSSRNISVECLGYSLTLFGGILFFQLAFTLSDIMNELFGYKAVQQVIWTTSIGLIVAGCLLQYTLKFPSTLQYPNDFIYLQIFNIFPTAFMMHGAALLFSDLANARLFSYLRGVSANRYLWLRSLISTFIAQMVYTIFCTTLAYIHGYHPTKTIPQLVELAFSDHFFKMGIAIASVPLIYLVVHSAYWWGYKKNLPRSHHPLLLEA